MSVRLSFYAFQPGPADVPPGSGTGAFITGLVNLLEGWDDPEHPLEVDVRWLRPAEVRGTGAAERWLAAAGWTAAEAARLLRDPARYLLLVYPKTPIAAHTDAAALLGAARRLYQALRLKTALTGQRPLVLVEDLPLEMAEGRAAAGGPSVSGGPAPQLPVRAIRGIERTLFRGAHRLIAPAGFASLIRERYGLAAERVRTFRRNIYMPGVDPRPNDLEFESGSVNFFYSGYIDPSVAPNFKEVLRAIRNAPETRLHVCGPGGDAVREWFAELETTNARHYGRLTPAVHDWLAERCDIGLILYPTDNPYNHLTPTMKYSAYLANGLAVLSTDLRCVAENIGRDGVGQALPIAELALELLRWATRPGLWRKFRDRARELAPEVRSGAEMRGWIEEVARGE